MRFITTSLFSLALAAGCAVDDEPAIDEPVTDEPAGTVEAALCFIGTTAPPPDWIHNFKLHPDTTKVIYDYGSSECSKYVVEVVNGGSPNYEHGVIEATVGGTVPTNPDACVGTSLTMRHWDLQSDGSWTSEAVTRHAEWTASGCVLPTLWKGSYGNSGSRFAISAKRTYCPSGGQYCAYQYALPLRIRAEER